MVQGSGGGTGDGGRGSGGGEATGGTGETGCGGSGSTTTKADSIGVDTKLPPINRTAAMAMT